MALTNAARLQTVNMLLVDGVKKLKSEFLIKVDGLIKQSRPGKDYSVLSLKLSARQAAVYIFCVKRISGQNQCFKKGQ